jgi:hypothetical protein
MKFTPPRSRLHRPSPAMTVALLALFVALGGTTYAATGGNFILGKPNSAGATTSLSAPVAGKALQVTNTSTGAGATGLGLSVATGHSPFTVNSGTKVAKLNADLLDGADSSAFLSRSKVKWARVDTNGTLGAHSGVTLVKHGQQGVYRVTFDQDVSACAYSATPAKDIPAIGALSDAPGNPTDVLVVMNDGVNPVDTDFSVEAFC